MLRREFLSSLALFPLVSDIAAPPRRAANWPDPSDRHYWRWIRQQFDIPRNETYFNVSTLGPRPRYVTDAVVDHMREIEKTIAHYDYRPEHPEYFAGYRKQEELRAKVAPLLGATGREVALVMNATMGSNFIANGIEMQPGDEVLLTDQEHIGNIGPWELREKRYGIVIRKVPIGADPDAIVRAFADAITPKTRAIDVPHITSRLGIVMPVKRICDLARERNMFCVIDGAQAIGHLRIDVKAIGCDAYVTSPHKWLLAPAGNGLLYVREERLKDVWATLASGNWNNYNDGAFRLMQNGTANLSLLAGFDAAIDFHMKIGPERVEQRILELANRLRQGLQQIPRARIFSPTHPALACGIVTWGLEGLPGGKLMDELWNRKKIRVRAVGDTAVRQSCHFYNTPEEVDAVLEIARGL